MANTILSTRQTSDDYVCSGYYCYSLTSWIIKWVIFAVIIATICLYCIGGYIHAKRRMKKGLAPLRYHRWLIPRRTRIAFHAQHPELPNPYATMQHARTWYTPGYGMHVLPNNAQRGYYGPPPPGYGTPEWLPAYAPPQQGTAAAVNGNKVDPNQVYVREEGTSAAQGSGQQQGAGQR